MVVAALVCLSYPGSAGIAGGGMADDCFRRELAADGGLYNVFCPGGLMARFDLLHLHSVE